MRQQKGFSLIELIIAVVLMGIISVIVGRIMFQAYQTFLTTKNISQTEWQGYLPLSRLTDDIHQIRSSNDISTASATQLTFTNQSGTSVTYQLSGSTLLRNSQILASGVQSFAMTYKDKNNAITATTANIRYIVISITITQENISQTFNTTVATRAVL